MVNITAFQTAIQSTKKLTEGPGATKLKESKPLLDNISPQLEKEFKELLKVIEPGVQQWTKRKLLRRRLEWPLKKEDIEKTIQLLEQFKTTLMTVIACDQM